MTAIAFHFNAPDKLAYACRFLRKALRHEVQVTVLAPRPALQALSPMLWQLGPQEFLAHALQDEDADMVALSPVVLADGSGPLPQRGVLLNLGRSLPEGFESFERVVEVVSADDDQDRAAARERWKQYTARGFAIERHDLVLKGG